MAKALELGSVSTGVRAMFYMLTPNESSFQKVEDVPQYVQQVGAATRTHLHKLVSLVELAPFSQKSK